MNTPPGFPIVIGFTGPAGHGKTTAAMMVLRLYADFHRQSFADPLRRMLLALGVDAVAMQDRKSEPHPALCGRTPRYALQTLGTEWGRYLIGPDIWLNAARAEACRTLAMGQRVVFDDVRFDNEAEMIRELGGVVISLQRPGLPGRMAHASESGISPALCHWHIAAEGTQELQTRLCAYLNSLAAY